LWGFSTVKLGNEEVYILPLFSSSSLSSSNKGSPDTGDIADCKSICSSCVDEGKNRCTGKGTGTKAEGAEVEGGEKDVSKIIKTVIEERNREEDVSIKIDL
jgi:hypothetical protein